jgi:hypothetical protein
MDPTPGSTVRFAGSVTSVPARVEVLSTDSRRAVSIAAEEPGRRPRVASFL